MTTKERVQAELERLSEDELGELLRVIQTRQATPASGLLDKLRRVQIDAPADFAAHWEQYASDQNIH